MLYRNDFEKQLLDGGYKRYPDTLKKSLGLYQKKVTDDIGVKYFINGYHYNLNEQYPDHFHEDNIDRYSFDVQFKIVKDRKEAIIDIRYSSDFLPNPWRNFTSLKDVENFYEKMWNDVGAEYYDLNDK